MAVSGSKAVTSGSIFYLYIESELTLRQPANSGKVVALERGDVADPATIRGTPHRRWLPLLRR